MCASYQEEAAMKASSIRILPYFIHNKRFLGMLGRQSMPMVATLQLMGRWSWSKKPTLGQPTKHHFPIFMIQ